MPTGQLFLECDRSGRILWMNDKCRQRLGEAASLVDSLVLDDSTELSRFLTDPDGPDKITGLFRRADGSSVPVCFYCFTQLAHSVILAAEVRERASDTLGVVNQDLIWLNSIVLEKYFRLLRAQHMLDSRLRRIHRNPGMVLIEQLERERARLGRELHSGPGQWLSAIGIHIELIGKKMPDLPGEIRQYLDRIASAANEAGAEIRAVSHRLHPLSWQSRDLPDALRHLWENSAIPETFQASLTLDPLLIEPPQAVRAAVYRAAQEAISNAARHSGATSISMSLSAQAGNLRLLVEDNGKGFDPAAPPASAGIGLTTIREQVESLGGHVHITSSPEGTKLEISVPLDPIDEQA